MRSTVIRSPHIREDVFLVGAEDLVDSSLTEENDEPGDGLEETLEFDDEEVSAAPVLPDTETIIAAALAEAQATIEQERAVAAEEGRLEGLEAAELQMQQDCNRLASLIDATQMEYGRALHENEAQMIQLCMTVGERIARASLAESGELLAGIVQEALSRAVGGIGLKVRLHPDDHELISGYWDGIVASREGHADLVKTIDDSVERGGCIIEAEGGHIDARIASRIEAVAESIGALSDHQENGSTD